MWTSPRACWKNWTALRKELNISRQAVIKTLIRQALDQQYLARGIRPTRRRR